MADAVNHTVQDVTPDIVESMRDLTDEELSGVYAAMKKGYAFIPPVQRNKSGEIIPNRIGSRHLFKLKPPVSSTEE